MKWITSTEGKVEGRGNNRPKPSTEAQTPLEKQQSQHLSDVQDVLSLCFSCSIVSLVGSGFFSLVSVFFSLVLWRRDKAGGVLGGARFPTAALCGAARRSRGGGTRARGGSGGGSVLYTLFVRTVFGDHFLVFGYTPTDL